MRSLPLTEREYCIASAAEFEGSHLLQVFAFEEDLGANLLIQALVRQDRRAMNIGFYPASCLLDVDENKLRMMGSICRHIVATAGQPVRITTTTDPQAAFDGARYVVTTIRVGGDEGRILDEKIALRHGVLGQETTGPGGFLQL